jgi:hypothetical protein
MRKSILVLGAVLTLTVIGCKKVKAETKALLKQTAHQPSLQIPTEK